MSFRIRSGKGGAQNPAAHPRLSCMYPSGGGELVNGSFPGSELIPGHQHLPTSQLFQLSLSLPALRPHLVSLSGHGAGISQSGLS